MPFVLGIEQETYSILTIGFGLLLLVYTLYKISKNDQLNPIIEKLNKKLDEVDNYLEKGKGIIEISKEFENTEGIPAVLTMKSILHTLQEGVKEDVLTYANVFDRKAPSDVEVTELLKQLLSDFDKKASFNISDRISELDEFRNVLYFKKDVLFKTKLDGEESKKGFGILIITLHEVMFIPMKWEFMKNMDKEKIVEMLNEATSTVPFLNVGVATSELLLAFHEEMKPEEVYLNDKRKAEMEKNYIDNEGWKIHFKEMIEFILPYRMKGLKGVSEKLTIKTKTGSYELWQEKGSEEFKLELLEQLLLSNLLYEQVFYPVYEKYEGFLYKCELVPTSEINYDDPRMIEFREQEIKNN